MPVPKVNEIDYKLISDASYKLGRVLYTNEIYDLLPDAYPGLMTLYRSEVQRRDKEGKLLFFKNANDIEAKEFDAKNGNTTISKRKCLMCRDEFNSQWNGDRVCGTCKTGEAWNGGSLEN